MRSLSALLLAAAALGLAAPVHADGISRLCEMDRKSMPQGCFYVTRSNLLRKIMNLSTGEARVPQIGHPIYFPNNEVARLCEMDRKGRPQTCFYVMKSDVGQIIRDYSTEGKTQRQQNFKTVKHSSKSW